MASLLQWMELHDKLSGWAQAVGALIALFIAIMIPAWQRMAERRDARIAAAALESVICDNVFRVMLDSHLYATRAVIHSKRPAGKAVDELGATDLLARILQLEQRETDFRRGEFERKCRNVVLSGMNMLRGAILTGEGPNDYDLRSIEADLGYLDRDTKHHLFNMDRATRYQTVSHFPGPIRFIWHLIWWRKWKQWVKANPLPALANTSKSK
jgi:hypothetical protein